MSPIAAVAFLLTVILVAPVASAQTPAPAMGLSTPQTPVGTIPKSLRNEIDVAINRGLDWLVAQQNENGAWSDTNFPALTALPLWAFAESTHPKKKEVTDKAVAFILTCVQPDGGIYRAVPGRKGGGLSNYNTAICMTALHATRDPALVPIVQKARKFVASAQHFGDDEYKGGFGYDKDTQRAYTDLLNTYYTVQAMRLTQDVEDKRPQGEQKVDINWSETVKYIERMQNKPAAGTQDAGGFFYNPTDPKGGTSTNAAGMVVMRSYGSITYAGLLALIYADVNRDDVRIRSAFDWASKHWTLEENPGMGAQGLYFFYNVMARSLDTYGADMVPREGAAPLNWREELGKKLVSLQNVDSKTGQVYWENKVGRYWENDKVLVTAYTLLALENL